MSAFKSTLTQSVKTGSRSRRVAMILFAVLIIVPAVNLSRAVADEPSFDQPPAIDRSVATVMSTLLHQEHLSRQQFDDEKATRAVKRFLEDLDPRKVHFFQADIDQFQADAHKLDDQVREGDLSFGYRIFQRFLERVDQRTELAISLLHQPYDFSVRESIDIDSAKVTYPTTEQDAAERWRKRVKYDLLLLKSQAAEALAAQTNATSEDRLQQARETLKHRYTVMAQRWHQFNAEDLREVFLTAVSSSFDPHTIYMSETTLASFSGKASLKMDGIGTALELDDGYTKITRIIAGGPADKAGNLKPGDRIVSVGQGNPGPMVDIVGMKLGDVVELIRGPTGTSVRLGVIPAGQSEVQLCDLIRTRTELKDREARSVIVQQGTKPDGTPYKIGVIDVPSFYREAIWRQSEVIEDKSTIRDVRDILRTFTEQGVDAVILNLRQNCDGASLTEAIEMVGLFIGSGPVVQTKNSAGELRRYGDRDAGMTWSGPLVVMTSSITYHASEIFAGAIQDYCRGLVVGDRSTHGKGTVQGMLDLGAQLVPEAAVHPPLGGLRITVQQLYRPSGESTQKRGVIPDVVLPALSSHFEVGEANRPYVVEFDRVARAEFNRYNMVTDTILAELRQRSECRRRDSADFAKLNRVIERYHARKDRDTVTLNEEEFLAARKIQMADNQKEMERPKQVGNERQVFELDFYNQEVVHLTTDYLQLLGSTKVAEIR